MMKTIPSFKLIAITAQNLSEYSNLSSVYEAEFAPLTGAIPDATGHYPISTPVDEMHLGWLLEFNAQYIGFMVINVTQRPYDVCEYFVLPQYRKHGFGGEMCCRKFDELGGEWTVKQLLAATAARRFWLKVLDQYTNGQFVETLYDDSCWGRVYMQSFVVREKKVSSDV